MLHLTKTLTEPEGADWGKPGYSSNLVVNCHQMRYKPVGELTDGDVRTAICQQFSLPIVVPMALERLEHTPFLQADLYEGDLLKAVLMAEPAFWAQHPDLWRRTNEISLVAWPKAVEMDQSWRESIEPDLQQIMQSSLAKNGEIIDRSKLDLPANRK